MEIKGYIIEKEIGHGGMATVYLAVQTALERQVALKIMNPTLAADPDFTVRFLREGPIAAKLNDPQIVTIYDTGVDGQHYYLAMEYLPGGTLKQKIKKGLHIEQALSISKMLGSALGYAHSRGVLHRDFKPQNILFRDNGTPVLTDFGIAKAVGGDAQMTLPGTSIGSPMYMSPEQAKGADLDERADIYSFGVVFYEMLAGKTPYQSKDTFALALMHVNDPVPKLPDELAMFQHIVDKLLAKEPDDRFTIAEQFVEELKQAERDFYGAQHVPGDSGELMQATQRIAGGTAPRPHPEVTGSNRAVAVEPPRIGAEPPAATTSTTPRLGYTWGLTLGTLAVVAAISTAVYLHRPADIGALLREAQSLKEQSSFAASLERIDQGLALAPGNAGLQRLRDEVLAAQQRRVALESALGTAQSRLEQQDYAAALEHIQTGLQLAPGDEKLLALRDQAQLGQENEQRRQLIEQRLARAEQQFAADRFTEPEGDNAADSFFQILELDKDNAAALDGLQRIADHFLERAQQSRDAAADRDAASFEETLFFIDQGLSVAPGNVELQALRGELEQEHKKIQSAQRALTKAEEFRAAGDYRASLTEIDGGLEQLPDYPDLLALRRQVVAEQTRAEQDAARAAARSARETAQRERLERAQSLRQQGQFEEALALLERSETPLADDPELAALRDAVAADLQSLRRQSELQNLIGEAERLLTQNQPADAAARIDRGLALDPGNALLLQLRGAVERHQQTQQQIAALLQRAGEQFDRNIYTVPEDDSAFANYQKVLSLDPANADARAGIAAIGAAYLQLAEKYRSDDPVKSAEFVDRGLTVTPRDPELVALQTLLNARRLSDREDNPAAALGEVERGLETAPDHPQLLALRDDLQRRSEQRARAQAAQQSLLAARRLRADGALQAAADEVEAGLRLLPDDPGLGELRALLRSELAADAALDRARELAESGEFDASLAAINDGLQQVPQQPRLLALRSEVSDRAAAQERQRRALDLLEQARALDPNSDDQLTRALVLIEQGLELVPGQPALTVLQNRLLAQRIRRADDGEVLAEVQRLIDLDDLDAALERVQQRLQQTPDDETLQTLQDELILALVAEDERRQRQNRILRYVGDAERLAADGDLAAALDLLDNGLRAFPDQTELLRAQADIARRLGEAEADRLSDLDDPASAAEADTQEELDDDAEIPSDAAGLAAAERLSDEQLDNATVEQLLAVAEYRVSENDLTSPDGGAYRVYQTVLKKEPDNPTARAGIDTIVSVYSRWARSNLSRGDLDKAGDSIRKALRIAPRSSTLRALNDQLEQQRAAAAAPAAEPQPAPTPPEPVSAACAQNPSSLDCYCENTPQAMLCDKIR